MSTVYNETTKLLAQSALTKRVAQWFSLQILINAKLEFTKLGRRVRGLSEVRPRHICYPYQCLHDLAIRDTANLCDLNMVLRSGFLGHRLRVALVIEHHGPRLAVPSSVKFQVVTNLPQIFDGESRSKVFRAYCAYYCVGFSISRSLNDYDDFLA